MPGIREVMCLSFNYTDAAGNAAQTVHERFKWWTQLLRLSVYLGMPILRTRQGIRTLMPMQVGQMRWMEAEQLLASGQVNARNSWKLCVKF